MGVELLFQLRLNTIRIRLGFSLRLSESKVIKVIFKERREILIKNAERCGSSRFLINRLTKSRLILCF